MPAANPQPSQTPTATPSAPSATPSSTPGATGTSGTMSPSAPSATGGAANAEAAKHLDAIDEILSKAKDGKLDKDQTEQIKTHLDQLRQLLNK
jgi:hypothetical protein